jgi:hypothetical protein
MNESLIKELIRRGKQDQNMRNKCLKDGCWDDSVDKENTKFMKEIIKNTGWPKISDVGKKAANIAWLLVQHADLDPAFQKQCLKLIESLPEGEIDKRNIAYLVDRVLVTEGKPQLYGSQFNGIGKTLAVQPIKDISNLDKRRKKMNLGSFAEYEKIMTKNYGK